MVTPSYENGVTPARPEYKDKVDKKTKALKRKAESYPLVPCEAYFPKCKITGVEVMRKRLKMTEEDNYAEHERMIQKIINSKFKIPIDGYCGARTQKTLGLRKPGVKRALWDPYMENALVLYTPPELTEEQKTTIDEKDKLVHVVVDPLLGNKLRPHQREGVKFMYDCVTGSKIVNNYGCIMADEMGLGKTLQCITLMWTLLRQSPLGKPTFSKAIIVCPSSLVKNWDNEITKWLKGRINPMPIDSGKREEIRDGLTRFMNERSLYSSIPVVIISYETFRIHVDILSLSEIGMVICDEGHRLKNNENLTYQALSSLKCSRRILISGTPIQNDLLEYYSLINFVNPGMLGSAAEFKKNFENPILKGRDSLSDEKQRKLSEEKLQELSSLVSHCIIRRTSILLTKYLPVKYEFVVCCNLTNLQENLYKQLISTKKIDVNKRTSEGAITGQAFTFITSLKKLCNHPQLIYDRAMKKESGFENCQYPSDFAGTKLDPRWSGKMWVLDYLLALTKRESNDKFVLISNYTETLDTFVQLCRIRGYRYVRLDGSMSIKKRGKIVKEFNDPESDIFIFLLSSKAGGCGLNLIGANRLVMFDPDWNPANDDQAMARVWRDGQKKTCFVYRFLATGTIEEKMFQRQTHKKALSSCVVDEQTEVERHFSTGELKSLFELRTDTNSDTHDKLKCKRCVSGKEVKSPPDDADTNSDLSLWHHTTKDISKIPDTIFRGVLSVPKAPISFTFFQKSHDKEVQKKAPKKSEEEKDSDFENRGDDSDYSD
uniref:DNA repair and recombination protein RAD54-like n=1 Tax=Strongyloides venezuelensis TaxID=75913 RepID=A0A0K0F5W5_STRVS